MRLIEKGEPMNPRGRFPTLAALVVLSSSASYGATIIGTVTGPDGTALEGVFVQAQNHNANMTFMALSTAKGITASRNCHPGIISYRPRSLVTAANHAPA